MELETDNSRLSGKEFRISVFGDLTKVVEAQRDHMRVLSICLDEMTCHGGNKSSCLIAAQVLLELYRKKRRDDHSDYYSAERLESIAQSASHSMEAAAEKAAAYAAGVMEMTEKLREVLRLDKPYASIYRCRSEAWDVAYQARLAAIVLKAIFDHDARAGLVVQAANIVGSRSPTRARQLIQALRNF